MHGATGHNDRCPRPDVELFARAVEAKPAFEHFKDLLPLFVKVERRPLERRDAGFDDREGPADLPAVQAHGHLLAGHRVEPVEVLAPADDGTLLFRLSSIHLLETKGFISPGDLPSGTSRRHAPAHEGILSGSPPGFLERLAAF